MENTVQSVTKQIPIKAHVRGTRAGIVQSLKSIKTESQDGVSSRKIGRNSRGTGLSDFSSQVS